MATDERPARRVTFGEALGFWIKLGWISFGGPAGQFAAALGAAASLAPYRFRLDVLRVVLAAGLLGLVKTYLLGRGRRRCVRPAA